MTHAATTAITHAATAITHAAIIAFTHAATIACFLTCKPLISYSTM